MAASVSSIASRTCRSIMNIIQVQHTCKATKPVDLQQAAELRKAMDLLFKHDNFCPLGHKLCCCRQTSHATTNDDGIILDVCWSSGIYLTRWWRIGLFGDCPGGERFDSAGPSAPDVLLQLVALHDENVSTQEPCKEVLGLHQPNQELGTIKSLAAASCTFRQFAGQLVAPDEQAKLRYPPKLGGRLV
jgi:hypothetical protein